MVSIGRLHPVKGYDRLIKVIAAYKDKYNVNIQLAIIGEGPDYEVLNQRIQQLALGNNIHLLGKKVNPFIYLNEAKLFVLTSKHEGFPNAVLEAGACGIPTVAFDVPGGIKEIITSGKNGFLVPDKAFEEMADCIHFSLKHPFDKAWIKRNTRQKFGLKKIIHQYENLFHEALSISPKITYQQPSSISSDTR